MSRRARFAFVGTTLAISVAMLVPNAFASPRSSGPTLSLSTGAATSQSGTVSVSVGGSVHISSTNLAPSTQAVLYKGQWEPNSQFVGWAYVYYAGYTPNADGTLSLDETQNTAGTFRYQICQSATSKTGKTTNTCSPYVELTVS